MVIASRCQLSEYFSDPTRPGSMTSTFPTYFVPFVLEELDDAAADALLLQPSDHPLTLVEAARARRWAGGHPCHVQAAGAAWYEAKVEHHSARWACRRFAQLKGQNCLVSLPCSARSAPARGRCRRVLRWVAWDLPCRVGGLAQGLGKKVDDVGAWIIGAFLLTFAVLLVLVLVFYFLGLATSEDIQTLVQVGLAWLKKGLGLGS